MWAVKVGSTERILDFLFSFQFREWSSKFCDVRRWWPRFSTLREAFKGQHLVVSLSQNHPLHPAPKSVITILGHSPLLCTYFPGLIILFLVLAVGRSTLWRICRRLGLGKEPFIIYHRYVSNTTGRQSVADDPPNLTEPFRSVGRTQMQIKWRLIFRN